MTQKSIEEIVQKWKEATRIMLEADQAVRKVCPEWEDLYGSFRDHNRQYSSLILRDTIEHEMAENGHDTGPEAVLAALHLIDPTGEAGLVGDHLR